MCKIQIFNDYQSSIKKDSAEKIGKFLSYPIRVMCGKRFQQDMVMVKNYSTLTKIFSVAYLLLAAPLAMGTSIVGVICLLNSSSHRQCLAIHSKIMRGYVIAGNEHLPLKKQAKEAVHLPQRLNQLLKHAKKSEILEILEETSAHPIAFQQAMGFLITEANQTYDFTKIKAALNSKLVLYLLRQTLAELKLSLKKGSKASYLQMDKEGLHLQLFLKAGQKPSWMSNKLAIPLDILNEMKDLVAEYKKQDQHALTLLLKEKGNLAANGDSDDFSSLKELITNASVKDILPILEGTIENASTKGFRKAIRFLLDDTKDKAKQASNKYDELKCYEKLQIAFEAESVQMAMIDCMVAHQKGLQGKNKTSLRLHFFPKNPDKLSNERFAYVLTEFYGLFV